VGLPAGPACEDEVFLFEGFAADVFSGDVVSRTTLPDGAGDDDCDPSGTVFWIG
jgi:hypothetical protein